MPAVKLAEEGFVLDAPLAKSLNETTAKAGDFKEFVRVFAKPQGKWKAGDGIRRTIRFLETMDCTILSGHRRVRPFGLAGGEPGQVGENWARRRDGRMERLQGCDALVLDGGDSWQGSATK